MRKLFFVLILFCLGVQGFSQKVRNVQYQQILDISPAKTTQKIKIEVALPQTLKGKQIVQSINFSAEPKRIYIENGIKYAEFYLKKPFDLQFIISATLKIFENDLSTLQASASLEPAPQQFLRAERHLEKDNPELVRVARRLKKKTRLKTVWETYQYVNRRLTYNLDSKYSGAFRAYQLKKGKCQQYSELFVTLCRTNGIPAKVINGFLITHDGNPRHAWAEVYFKNCGWVRFDPTNGNFDSFQKLPNKYVEILENPSTAFRKFHVNFFYLKWSYWGGLPKTRRHLIIR